VNGIQLARQFRDDFRIPVVFLTAHADAETLREAGEAEPFGFVVKPFDAQSLAATVEMALYRDRAEARVATMERWLSTTLTSIGDGVIATDAQYRVTFMNPRAAAMIGWQPNDAVGKPLREVMRLRGENGSDVLLGRIDQAVNRGIVRIEQQSFVVTHRGERLPIDESISAIREQDGSVTGIVIVFRDRTERLQMENRVLELNASLENRVRQRTAELGAANRELEMFAHSVSHDLRAPLRAINGYAQLLTQKYGESADEETRHFLGRLIDNSARMASMIDDYLRLARASQSELRCEQLDMRALVAAAWEEVTYGVPRVPRLIVGKLSPVDGDASLIRILIANLLSNAVKFSRRVADPEVRVTSQDAPERVSFSIADNGTGFDPRYTPKLFRVFERLHESADYEGNGIGLSIVQRIAQRHGGDVSIDAAPNQGATVTFWLPKKQGANS
jgi:PAS domain S-box-containing protein